MAQKTRILGVDYGEKRIGLAVSDPGGIIAQGLPTIVYRSQADAINQIAEAAATHRVAEVVVGLPLNLRGQVRASAERVHRFVDRLRKVLDVPVSLWDERLTSVMAEATLRQMGKPPSRNRKRVDQVAAVLLLQSYLDRRRKTT